MEAAFLSTLYPLVFLLAVVGPGDAEHEGDEEGQLGVRKVAVAKVDDAVEGPDSGADGPYPCCATHRSPDTGTRVSLDANGSVWIRGARIVRSNAPTIWICRCCGFGFGWCLRGADDCCELSFCGVGEGAGWAADGAVVE